MPANLRAGLSAEQDGSAQHGTQGVGLIECYGLQQSEWGWGSSGFKG